MAWVQNTMKFFEYFLPPLFPGPRATQGTSHNTHMCVVPHAASHVWNTSVDMLDDEVCNKIGRPFIRAEENPKHIPYYPLENIVFYSYIPFLRDRVMSREFEFLIMDLELNFLYSDFIRQFLSEFSAKWRTVRDGKGGVGEGTGLHFSYRYVFRKITYCRMYFKFLYYLFFSFHQVKWRDYLWRLHLLCIVMFKNLSIADLMRYNRCVWTLFMCSNFLSYGNCCWELVVFFPFPFSFQGHSLVSGFSRSIFLSSKIWESIFCLASLMIVH